METTKLQKTDLICIVSRDLKGMIFCKEDDNNYINRVSLPNDTVMTPELYKGLLETQKMEGDSLLDKVSNQFADILKKKSKLLTQEEFHDIHERELEILYCETGQNREIDFDFEEFLEIEYEKYLSTFK